MIEVIDQDIKICFESIEEGKNPLYSYWLNPEETMLISQVPTSEEISIAPGEGKKPRSILQYRFCEELAFLPFFSKDQFWYRVQREVKLRPVKYFNQWFLNYTQLFESDSDIFFALSVTQQVKLNSQINIAIKNLNADMFSGNFTETVISFISKDEAYNLMSSMKRTPVSWKKFLFEILGYGKTSSTANYDTELCWFKVEWMNEYLL